MNKEREKLIRLYGDRCMGCGFKHNKYGQVLEKDHIKPLSKEGRDGFFNLQLLCRRCNNKKRDIHYDARERFTTLRYNSEKEIKRNQEDFDAEIDERRYRGQGR